MVKYCVLEMRMFNATLEDAEQRLEQGLRGLNDLAVRLIELLILKQIGCLLVDVDARDGLLRGGDLRYQRSLRRARSLNLIRLVADVVDVVRVRTRQRDRAAVHRFRGRQVRQ